MQRGYLTELFKLADNEAHFNASSRFGGFHCVTLQAADKCFVNRNGLQGNMQQTVWVSESACCLGVVMEQAQVMSGLLCLARSCPCCHGQACMVCA